jgi:hypothetical protein
MTTTDPSDPRLTRGEDAGPVPQADVYLVLPDEELSENLVRPIRYSYRHKACGQVTTMGRLIALTYARDPKFYGGTYCTTCRMHRRVAEFTWVSDDGSDTGEVVGS